MFITFVLIYYYVDDGFYLSGWSKLQNEVLHVVHKDSVVEDDDWVVLTSFYQSPPINLKINNVSSINQYNLKHGPV